MKCTSDGKDKEVIEECEIRCIQDDEGVRCGDKDDEICPPIVIIKAMPPVIKNDITIPDFICQIKLFFKNLFAGLLSTFTILRWVVVLAVFVFSMLFSRDFLDRIKFVKKSKAGKVISWVSAVIFGILMGFLVFKLFWIGLILFIVLVLIKLFVPIPFK